MHETLTDAVGQEMTRAFQDVTMALQGRLWDDGSLFSLQQISRRPGSAAETTDHWWARTPRCGWRHRLSSDQIIGARVLLGSSEDGALVCNLPLHNEMDASSATGPKILG